MGAAEVIRSRLAEHEAEARRHEIAAAELRAVLALVEPEGDPPGNSQRPAPETAAAPAATGVRRRRAASKLAVELLRLLAGGQKSFGELVKATGKTQGGVTYQLTANPWFEKADPESRWSPWRLTEAGRAALAESPPPA